VGHDEVVLKVQGQTVVRGRGHWHGDRGQAGGSDLHGLLNLDSFSFWWGRSRLHV
jgi:hypothetical protein